MSDPIAYTYEADYHCPRCALARFGRSAAGWIGEGAHDSEGNPVGVVAPWDEWTEPSDPRTQVLSCGTCGDEIDRVEGDEDEDEAEPFAGYDANVSAGLPPDGDLGEDD